ncbi:hypothetical protein [Acinetobacter baumannii]|uniref:hypothetical protein n=1 Tax=Acinetobacter baumannii TaxID=470 RepID=UPI001D18DBA1|nr:hypothetical protein [Acinetobacter baumannii]
MKNIIAFNHEFKNENVLNDITESLKSKNYTIEIRAVSSFPPNENSLDKNTHPETLRAIEELENSKSCG